MLNSTGFLLRSINSYFMETRIYLVRYRTADNRVQTDFWEFPSTHRFYDYGSFLTVFYSLLELQNGYVLSIQFDTV